MVKNSYLGADDKHSSLLIDMLPRSDDIKLLIRASIARLRLYGDQVLAEITSCGINEKTSSIGRFDGDTRESTCGGVITLVGLRSSLCVQYATCAGDASAVGGGVLTGKETIQVRSGRNGRGKGRDGEKGECSKEQHYGVRWR